ncbi:hypothetical protein [Paraflavitalea speifideaquila]|uniref:hypothetical protein n=1 Tax=Paraflavitalea speifideaquila TaxID=3076558 RepID=UPI0028E968EE|nr:hypothetical protein [Paraflavitalea speifideiaquila]
MLQYQVSISPDLLAKAASLQEDAKTVIWFAANNQLLALMAIADKIKQSSKTAIETLQQRVLKCTCLPATTNIPPKPWHVR